MIIQSIRAENFRKYELLHLESIPEKGLILVAGGNESGKSSIGDAITFALFGFTDRVPTEASAKLVRWNCEKAQVQLGIKVRGRQFHLNRAVNDKGYVLASLWDVDHGVTLADTPDEVQAMLKDLLGYGYKTFSQTFYWSQQANENAQADSDSVQSMAGLQHYQHIGDALQTEYADTLKQAETIELEYQQTEQKLNDLQFDEMRLPALQEINEELVGVRNQHGQVRQQLISETSQYSHFYERFHKIRRKLNAISRWAMAGVLLMAILLAVAFLSIFFPDVLGGDLVTYQSPLIWGAAILAFVSGIALFYSWWLEDREFRPVKEMGGSMSQRLFAGYRLMKSPLPDILDLPTVEWLKEKAAAGEDVESLADMQSLSGWAGKVENYEIEPWDVNNISDGLSVNLERRYQTLGSLVAQSEGDIEQERDGAEVYQALRGHYDKQSHALAETQHLLDVQICSQQMLQRSSRYAVKRFNHVVGQRCQNLLTDFTQSQYQNIEMTDELALQVLSHEKGGFLEFDEISAGTQRQIALAMRVALAKALADSTDAQHQFLFLDEPFVFFDEERSQATLKSLLEASDQALTQIWMTVQSVPADTDAKLVIPCSKGKKVLTLTGVVEDQVMTSMPDEVIAAIA